MPPMPQFLPPFSISNYLFTPIYPLYMPTFSLVTHTSLSLSSLFLFFSQTQTFLIQSLMAIGGKLMKLKSVLKKLNSFNKQSGGRPRITSVVATTDDSCANAGDLHPVYVGKSRRRYLISSDIIDHPLFKELAERSNDSSHTINVACEVVLFEHLLWMLENADPQPESLEELAEFYVC